MSVVYTHLKRTLGDSGQIVPLEEVQSIIDNDRGTDWYTSAYCYHEDMVEYFENNWVTSKKTGKTYQSVAGYKGSAFTQHLHWDIDFDGDLPKAQEEAQKLYSFLLNDLRIDPDAVNVYFSGSKGFHIILYTTDSFDSRETTQICYNIAHTAGVEIDTVVYNPTRAFRIMNTRHQKSGLFKIQLTGDELFDLRAEDITDLAQDISPEFPANPMPAEDLHFLRRDFYTEIEETKVTNIEEHRNVNIGLDMSKCPPGMRRCIYTLENGYFGPGERENALIRVAAYYKGQGKDVDLTRSILETSLRKRAEIFPNADDPDPSDTERILDTVFSDSWTGATYSCRSDRFLQQHCDAARGCKAHELKPRRDNVVGSGFINVQKMTENYIAEANSSPESYPETGLKWLDERVYIRPKCYSVINGANGAGKTSLVTTIVDNFNSTKVPHAIFSMDMADNQLFLKLGSKYTNYNYRQIESAFNPQSEGYSEEIKSEVVNALAKALPYTYFNFTAGLTVEEMGESILQLEAEVGQNIQVAFVDYAGRLINELDSMYASATMNATKINDIAKDTNCHFVVLSQISREGGDHTDPIRTSRISKDSGAWEENATFMLNIWRPLGKPEFEDVVDRYMTIFIAKNRGEETYKECTFVWDGRRGHIEDMTELDEQDFALDYLDIFKKLPILNIIKPDSEAFEALQYEMDEQDKQKKKSTGNRAKPASVNKTFNKMKSGSNGNGRYNAG